MHFPKYANKFARFGKRFIREPIKILIEEESYFTVEEIFTHNG